MTNTTSYDPAQIKKLEDYFAAGILIEEERATLNDGLKDLTAAIAEEMNIKPGLLSKALKLAVKASFTQQETDFETVGDILRAVKRDL
jgi:prophage DNA circulation protein